MRNDAIAKLEAKVKERGDFIERAGHINEILRAAPERIGDAVIVEGRDANRVQIRFDDLPPKELPAGFRGSDANAYAGARGTAAPDRVAATALPAVV